MSFFSFFFLKRWELQNSQGKKKKKRKRKKKLKYLLATEKYEPYFQRELGAKLVSPTESERDSDIKMTEILLQMYLTELC